ncbi:uncharacterized protein LOC107620131 [Arachis ipaensis]|uniref:uncharacterized protein LOC107620131 n=1 Tax=Arachis ipaensis TaxID=130454 RepID=UPI0007AFB89F|nr:uncharacterized protein LOC107620131 [Arachis ipaensis]
MEKAARDNLISGIRLAPTAPPITHLLFADDCIIFTRVQEDEIYQLIQIINKYTETSGQRINTEKSGLIFGRHVPIQSKVNTEEITGMASWEDPERYLGLPARWGRSKNKALEWIEEKILDKMQGWKEKLLNQAGKEVLIKAVIQAIPIYAMNVIKFPISFCKRIEAATARFWWSNNEKERSIHWKSWTKMTKSKKNGGLGFKGLECQNIAHLAKQAWRLLKEEDAIWARILKPIYYPNCNLWEAEEGRNASWIWKSMSDGEYSVRTGYHNAKEEKDAIVENRLSKAQVRICRRFGRQFGGYLYHKSICQQADETVEHALLLCPWTRAVWFRSSLQFLPTVHNVTSFGSWVINTIAKIKRETAKDQEKILCKLGCVCWCIWKERNQHIFQQSQVKPEKVIFASEHLAVEFYNAIEKINNENRSGGGRSTEKKRVTWRPPPKDWLKVNTDAAFHRETGMAASAVVARDWRGKIVSGLTTTFKSTSCLAVEAQAYREALILIKNLQLGKCIIETDCLPLVQAIKAKISLAETDAIIRDTLHLLNEAPAVGVTWTPRDGNKLAHQLASMAAGNGLQRQWIVNPHAQIKNTIRTEVEHFSRRKIYRIIPIWFHFQQAIKDNTEKRFYL